MILKDKLLTLSPSTGAASACRLGSSQHFQMFLLFILVVLCYVYSGINYLRYGLQLEMQQTAVLTQHCAQCYSKIIVLGNKLWKGFVSVSNICIPWLLHRADTCITFRMWGFLTDPWVKLSLIYISLYISLYRYLYLSIYLSIYIYIHTQHFPKPKCEPEVIMAKSSAGVNWQKMTLTAVELCWFTPVEDLIHECEILLQQSVNFVL